MNTTYFAESSYIDVNNLYVLDYCRIYFNIKQIRKNLRNLNETYCSIILIKFS